MTTQTHTPGPWSYSMGYIRSGARKIANLSDGTDFEGRWTDPEQNANARRIVRAVNCHADLLAALQRVTEYAERFADEAHEPSEGDCRASVAAAFAAIAKATGQDGA